MIQFENKLDVKQVKKELSETKNRYAEHLTLINALLEVLKPFDGKPISKRIATAFEKHSAVKNYRVYYSNQYGMFHIKAWKGSMDNCFNPCIGYESSPIVNLEKIKESNKCYTLNAERLENMEKTADQVEGLVNDWNKALEALQAVHAKAEKVEGLEYKLDIKIR